jgi:hypothetical protein
LPALFLGFLVLNSICWLNGKPGVRLHFSLPLYARPSQERRLGGCQRFTRIRPRERQVTGRQILPANDLDERKPAVRPAFDHPVGRRGGPVAFMVKQRPPIK